MDALTEAQIDGLNGIWRFEDIDDDRYEDDWRVGFNSAAREIREKIASGSSVEEIKGVYSNGYTDINDERYQDDWTRGTYSLYRDVDKVLAA